jgi:hypothetical protein
MGGLWAAAWGEDLTVDEVGKGALSLCTWSPRTAASKSA